MFLECKNNGVFFIINDKESNIVSKFVKDNEKDFEIVRVRILGRNIDIYKSRKLISEFVLLMFIEDKAKPKIMTSAEPKKPEETEEPKKSEEPEEPQKSEEPEKPKKPEEPLKSEEPEKPKKPEELKKSEEPEEPKKPEEPKTESRQPETEKLKIGGPRMVR